MPPDPYRRRATRAPPSEELEGTDMDTLGGQIGGQTEPEVASAPTVR